MTAVSPATDLIRTLTFEDPRDFQAETRACGFLESAGFSVGRKQARAPRGILFGLYDIQKWRNLSAADREALHGVMVSDGRNGPVNVEIFDTAPDAAKAAIEAASMPLLKADGHHLRIVHDPLKGQIVAFLEPRDGDGEPAEKVAARAGLPGSEPFSNSPCRRG